MLRDRIEPFELTDETLRRHSNEAGTLNYLYAGLEFLYQQVKRSEAVPLKRFVSEVGDMSDPEHDQHGLPAGVTICAFHWYATTACNFVKMIAWIRQQQDAQAEGPQIYMEKVLPAVQLWRNKVSAHFAVHTPHKKDTAADKMASVIPPTALVHGRYTAGAYQVMTRRAGQTSSSSLLPWSLTVVHEELRNRYGLSGA